MSIANALINIIVPIYNAEKCLEGVLILSASRVIES